METTPNWGEIRGLIKGGDGEIIWNHAIDLINGKVTDGTVPMGEHNFDFLDFKGKRVMDVGCSNGFHSFLAEERGASEVVSFDICDEQFGEQKQEGKPWEFWVRGYLYAHQERKSNCKYIFPYSVYQLNKDNFGEFDIVLCLGVLYHLVHPALALENINKVMKIGSILVVDCEVSPVMTSFYGPEHLYNQDKTNFWVIRREELFRLLRFCGFEVIQEYHRVKSRQGIVLKKVREIDSKYSVDSVYSKEKNILTNIDLAEWQFRSLGVHSVLPSEEK